MKVTNLYEREIEGKFNENEENKGINNKKVYEDQFIDVCEFSFGALSIPSYYCTLRAFLDHSRAWERRKR